MASISTDPKGNRTIQFVAADRARRSIRLGKVSEETAERIRRRIETLNTAVTHRAPPDDETVRWVATLDGTLRDKLIAVGLAAKRLEPAQSTLAPFIDAYIAGRTDVKPNTKAHLDRARRNLVDFFGGSRQLAEISAGDADDFRRHLLETMADNTVRRICSRAKQFFRTAVRKRLILESPFGDMKGTAVRENREREHFVTREVARAVLDACPDAQWRLLFALSRYGGLRCPSEHLALSWVDIDWERGRIRVRSPKTEHHEGKGFRWVPLFPELRPHLAAAFELAEPGTTHVITRYRDCNANLRTQLERIIRKAGLEPWAKPFQNLRSTRETELAETYPIHVVCAWIGNSQMIAAKHYLQVTDEHFAQAAGALQNPVQQGGVGASSEREERSQKAQFSEEYDPIRNSTSEKAPRKEPSSKQCAPFRRHFKSPSLFWLLRA